MSFLETIIFNITRKLKHSSMEIELDEEGLPCQDITIDMVIPSSIDDHSTIGVE